METLAPKPPYTVAASRHHLGRMRADICVLYLSEDEAAVDNLVIGLRQNWNVWCGREITSGSWEEQVRSAIGNARVVVPVLSKHARGNRRKILDDEMRYADDLNKTLLPFLIGRTELPLGLGGLNRTEATGWTGDLKHPGYLALLRKLATELGTSLSKPGSRPRQLDIGGKSIRVPTFAFSLSSHETQLKPKDGVELIRHLQTDSTLVESCLISAYDYSTLKRDKRFYNNVRALQTKSVIILDSGNYEAERKGDSYSPKNNPKGWRREAFHEAALSLAPDLVFSFDKSHSTREAPQLATRILRDLHRDQNAFASASFALCPIVRLPREFPLQHAPKVFKEVAKSANPVLLAVPERELGDGLRQRVKNVRAIRAALNTLSRYYPLHLLGTGNPLSMTALAAAGADSFDGLEWCRTVAEYETGYLFHFQHFDFFAEEGLRRIRDKTIRAIVSDSRVPYNARVACYNLDFYADWVRTMQDMIHSGQVEHLLKVIPKIATELFTELSR